MNLRQTFTGLIAAIVAAVILWVVFSVPFKTILSVILLLAAIEIVQKTFGTGLTTTKEWIVFAGRVLAGAVIFVVLRFLAGQALGLYPIGAYDEWVGRDSAHGIFWGRQATLAIVWEVLFVIVAFKLVTDWVAGKKRLLVTTIFVTALLAVTAQHSVPKTVAAATAGFKDDTMAKEIEDWRKAVGDAKTPAQAPQLCADAEDFRFDPEKGVKQKSFLVRSDCYTGWINTLDWAEWNFQTVEETGLEFTFEHGERVFVPTTKRFGYGYGKFRLRAPIPGQVLVWVK